MNLQRVRGILEEILNTPPTTITIEETRLHLEKSRRLCRQLFQLTRQGDPVTYDLGPVVEIQDSIEQTLDQTDITAMLHHVREALTRISKANQ
jgi:hypothetical protein